MPLFALGGSQAYWTLEQARSHIETFIEEHGLDCFSIGPRTNGKIHLTLLESQQNLLHYQG
jgi:hypothetical protein